MNMAHRLKILKSRMHHCFYCNVLVTNFRRHVFRHHDSEEEVKEILSINDDDLRLRNKKRRLLLDALRKKGNYVYNSRRNVRKNRCILPVRQPTSKLNVYSKEKYVGCKYCFGTFSRKTFYRHLKICTNSPLESKQATNEENESSTIRRPVLTALVTDLAEDCQAGPSSRITSGFNRKANEISFREPEIAKRVQVESKRRVQEKAKSNKRKLKQAMPSSSSSSSEEEEDDDDDDDDDSNMAEPLQMMPIYADKEDEHTIEELKSYLDSLIETTKCPICLDKADTNMAQCVNGHIFCNKCVEVLNNCPTCQALISNNKQLVVLSQIVETMPQQCKHCFRKYTKDDHEMFCGFRIVFCKIKDCNLGVVVGKLLEHIQEMHKDEKILSENCIVILKDFQPEEAITVYKPMFVHGEFFWCEIINDIIGELLTVSFMFEPNGKATKNVYIKAKSIKFNIMKFVFKIKLDMDQPDKYNLNYFCIPNFMLPDLMLDQCLMFKLTVKTF